MKLVILGAGGYGQTVADLARQSEKYQEIAFLDDRADAAEVLGRCEDFAQFQGSTVEMYPAFGDSRSRLSWLSRLTRAGIPVASLIHPTAYVSPTVTMEAGCMVLPCAVVNTGCQMGRGCIVNCGAIVDHGCILEEGVHVCLGAIVKAENRLPACMKVEAGQVIENRTWPL